MKQILSNYLDATIELNYGGTATVKGQLQDILEDVVKLKGQDDTIFYVPINKIHVFWEVKEQEKAVGFVTKQLSKNR